MMTKKFFKRCSGLILAVALVGLIVITNIGSARADTDITITSPANGQSFSGNSFTISGTTDANATVLIQKSTTVLAQTKSDSSGKFSAKLTDLPDGKNTITAKVVKNTGFAIFVSDPGGGADFQINSLRLSDNSINTISGYPKSFSTNQFFVVPSPAGNIFYLVGGFSPTIKPAKFDADNPSVEPETVTGSYPTGGIANKGDFNAAGTKYYSPNLGGNTVSVIDVATNTWTKDIDFGTATPTTVWRAPNGNLFVTTLSDDGYKIVDPTTDEIIKSVPDPCTDTDDVSPTVTFSSDPSYPYYFASCVMSGKVVKMKSSDNSIVDTWTVGTTQTAICALSPDNKKLYCSGTAAVSETDADKVRVINTTNGGITTTIDLAHGTLGYLPSPDFQHIYTNTAGNSLDQTGIDVLNTFDDSVEHIATDKPSMLPAASPATTADISDVQVGVVLGVATGTLANTGVVIIPVAILAVIILAILIYTYTDFRKHRKPLVQADPYARQTYTYRHHISTVTIPLMRYRINISLNRSPKGLTKF